MLISKEQTELSPLASIIQIQPEKTQFRVWKNDTPRGITLNTIPKVTSFSPIPFGPFHPSQISSILVDI